MHEMSIAIGILEIIGDEMQKHPDSELMSFDVEIGEFSSVQEEALRFCLEAGLPETPWPGAAVNIRSEALKARCLACSHIFEPQDYRFVCPGCEAGDVQIIAGKDCRVLSLEIEE